MTADVAGERIEGLRGEYRRSLPDRVTAASQAWERLRGGALSGFEELWDATHALAGSAGTFGFWVVSDRARELQQLLAEMGPGRVPTDTLAVSIQEGLGRLAAAVEEAPGAAPAPSAGQAPSRVILLLERGAGEYRVLSTELAHLGWAPAILSDPARLVSADGAEAVVMDLHTAVEHRDLLARLAAGAPGAVIVATSARGDPKVRLAAAHLGVELLCGASPTAASLVEMLERQEPVRQGKLRLLLVDDEPERAEEACRELGACGLLVQASRDPLEALACLSESRPDVMLVHLSRPGYTACDLVRAMRGQESLVDVPVVVLAPARAPWRLRGLQLGADDVLPEGLAWEAVVGVLRARAARAATLRSYMTRDALTGLLNRATFEERLREEMARAWRDQQHLALGILDVDHFKSVNDAFGHPAGDRVLAALARVLRERLRGSDLAARIGGDEIAVILPGTEGSAACGVLDDVRQRFAEAQRSISGVACVATVSAGAAVYPEHGSPRALMDAADAALYRAKREGRNRVALGGERRRGRILVVDDDEDLTSLLQATLEGAGFDVLVAHDGLRGYELARERIPDLVLSDLLLPHLHGFKLCRRLKREPATRDIPVILLTGVYRKFSDELKAKGCGAADFLRKPLDPAGILARIDRLLPRRDETVARGA